MKITNIFFDTEFTGLHQGTTLVSIGLVADNGETFYAELVDYDKTQVDEWLQENVISKLTLQDKPSGYICHSMEFATMKHISTTMRGDTDMLKRELTFWLQRFDRVEMWSDCLSYDWVLFNHIFGHAFNIPKNVLYIPFDICTLFKDRGIDPDISREEFSGVTRGKDNKHHALWDAHIIKFCYEKLISKETEKIRPAEDLSTFGIDIKTVSTGVFEIKSETAPARIIDLSKFDDSYKEIIINHYSLTLEESNDCFENIHKVYPVSYEAIIAKCIYEMEQ